jgi:hypothetical protein
MLKSESYEHVEGETELWGRTHFSSLAKVKLRSHVLNLVGWTRAAGSAKEPH